MLYVYIFFTKTFKFIIDHLTLFQTVPTYPPVVLPIDITNINNLQTEITKIIDIHGRIDILINNAGISYRGEIINTNMDVDIKVMLTNYFAQIALAKGNHLILIYEIYLTYIKIYITLYIILQLFFHI